MFLKRLEELKKKRFGNEQMYAYWKLNTETLQKHNINMCLKRTTKTSWKRQSKRSEETK